MSQLRNEVDAHKENKNTEQSRIGNSKFIDLANLKINLKTMFHNSLNTKRDEIKSTKINSKDKIDNDNKISIKTSEKVIIEIDSKTPEFGPEFHHFSSDSKVDCKIELIPKEDTTQFSSRSNKKTHRRYDKISETKITPTESVNLIKDFEENDEIIINPEFNKTLKESLRQSKRRLMLFIDHNENVNPIEFKEEISKEDTQDKRFDSLNSVKFATRNYKKDPLNKNKVSLGLKKEDLETSESGEEDLCVCEIESIPNFYPRK